MEELNAVLRQQIEASSLFVSTMQQQLQQNESRIKELEVTRQNLESKMLLKEQENANILRDVTHLNDLVQASASHLLANEEGKSECHLFVLTCDRRNKESIRPKSMS